MGVSERERESERETESVRERERVRERGREREGESMESKRHAHHDFTCFTNDVTRTAIRPTASLETPLKLVVPITDNTDKSSPSTADGTVFSSSARDVRMVAHVSTIGRRRRNPMR